MSKPLDEKTKTLYLQNPEFCPLCESKNIMRADLILNKGRVSRRVWCRVCQREWLEFYSITDVVLESGT